MASALTTYGRSLSRLQVNKDAAWYYDQPLDKAKNIKDHVAFWKGVNVKTQ